MAEQSPAQAHTRAADARAGECCYGSRPIWFKESKQSSPWRMEAWQRAPLRDCKVSKMEGHWASGQKGAKLRREWEDARDPEGTNARTLGWMAEA